MPDELTLSQRAAVEHSGSALLIAAAAGSGKTRVLVERLMSRVTAPDGPDIDDFLVITFTRAAAAELRERISGELVKRLADEPSSRRLRRQLALVSRAHISTIDAFCSEIVRANAHLLGIRPDFRVCDEGESSVIHARVMDRLLEERYSAMTPAFRALAETMNTGKDDEKLETTIETTYGALQSHAYPRRWIEERLGGFPDAKDAGQTPWGRELLASAGRRNAALLRRLSDARTAVACDAKAEKAYGMQFDAAIEGMEGLEKALAAGWDAAFGFGPVPFENLGRVVNKTPEIEAAKRAWDACKAGQAKLAAIFSAPSSAVLAEMEKTNTVTDELLRCVLDYGDALDEEKKRKNVLEFGDILHLAVRLLIDGDGRPTPRALDIAEGFAEILVDEYQDVSGVQDMIFKAISRDGKNLVFVGDVKQSIYRFRLADPTIFLDKYNSWKDDPAPGEPRRILLSQNFRSRQGVLDAVNDVFSRIMSTELGEMEYGEDEALRGSGKPDGDPEKPFELLLLDTQAKDEDEESREVEAAAVAARVRRLLDSGMTVDGRPIEPGDIAVLMRFMKSPRGEIYASALRSEGIPVVLQKDEAPDEPAVAAVLSYLAVIDNPRQDVELIAVLRSPLFGFTSDELAAIRAADREGDFYSALSVRAREDAKCAAFMQKLLELREAAPELGLERLLRLIYDESGILAASATGGLYALLDAARAFEARGGAGLYGFVSELRDMEEAGKPFSLPTSQRTSGGVTLCTMHASKGLEWPVVVLADLPKRYDDRDGKKPLLIHSELGVGIDYVDLERRIKYPTIARLAVKARLKNEALSEEMRLLYVAMTRAKQKLIIMTAPTSGVTKWEKLLSEADGFDPALLEDKGNATDWLLLVAAELAGSDPKWVPEIVEPTAAVRAAAETEPEQADPACAALIAGRLDFVPPEPEAWRIPSKLTATELKGGVLETEAAEGADAYLRREPADLRRPVFESEGGRLSPTERGTALHKAVQFSDLALCATVEGAHAELEKLRARHMLTDAEADSVKPESLTALAVSPLGRRMLAAGELRREFKFSLLIPAGELLSGAGEDELLLQGVVDCLFDEGEGLVIVDFKSDNVTKMTQPAAVRRYAPQLGAYAKAMEKIFQRPVAQKLLYFFRTGETVEIK